MHLAHTLHQMHAHGRIREPIKGIHMSHCCSSQHVLSNHKQKHALTKSEQVQHKHITNL